MFILNKKEMIVRTNNKYKVVSHTTGRSFGTYPTKHQAEVRLRQVQFYKHHKK